MRLALFLIGLMAFTCRAAAAPNESEKEVERLILAELGPSWTLKWDDGFLTIKPVQAIRKVSNLPSSGFGGQNLTTFYLPFDVEPFVTLGAFKARVAHNEALEQQIQPLEKDLRTRQILISGKSERFESKTQEDQRDIARLQKLRNSRLSLPTHYCRNLSFHFRTNSWPPKLEQEYDLVIDEKERRQCGEAIQKLLKIFVPYPEHE